jgi:hypothetical protein
MPLLRYFSCAFVRLIAFVAPFDDFRLCLVVYCCLFSYVLRTVQTIVSGDFKISVALLSRALLACNIPRVYVVGYVACSSSASVLRKRVMILRCSFIFSVCCSSLNFSQLLLMYLQAWPEDRAVRIPTEIWQGHHSGQVRSAYV